MLSSKEMDDVFKATRFSNESRELIKVYRDRLRMVWAVSGFSVNKIAREVKMQPQTVAKFLNGTTGMQTQNLVRLTMWLKDKERAFALESSQNVD